MSNFQLVSDVHLEGYEDYSKIWDFIHPQSDTLVLPGDICSYATAEAIEFISRKFKKVICVLGNHDYYDEAIGFNSSWKPEVPDNVVLLEQSATEHDGVLYVGATLWSDLKNGDWFVKNSVMNMVEDFSCIDSFTTDKLMHRFKRSHDYIKNVVEQNRGKKIVIVTHFVPSYALIGEKWKHPSYELLNCYFSGNCDDIISICEPGTTWVYGHTHDASSKVLGDVNFYVNPLGYHGSLKFTSYRDLVVQV